MKLRVASLLSAVLVTLALFSFGHAKAVGPPPSFNFSATKTNVNYGESTTLHWTATNVTWCWGYRWATIPMDSDGSGWVQPPDQNTAAGATVTGDYPTLPLTSDKTYSMICGQNGSPLQLQDISITVGPQALSIKNFSPTSGSEDTTVIITGTAFDKVKQVKIGNKDADSYVVDGTTQISAVVAHNTSSGKIFIKTQTSSVTSTTDFTITPIPVLQSFTATSPITLGQSTTLTWTVNAQVTWCWGTGGLWGSGSWVQPPDQTHPGTGGSNPDSPQVNTTYTLQCGAPSNPRPIQSKTVTVTGQPPPPPATGGLPYFKVNGGDVFVGGWFNADSNSCNNDDPTYQAPLAWKSQDQADGTKGNLAGGIITYGSPPGSGASTTHAVFALGNVVRDSNSRYGFMSPGANQFSFANTFGLTAALWGGQFEGSEKQTHCIPDYYNTKRDLPKVWANKIDGLESGQYFVNGDGETPVVIPGAKIDPTQNVTIFVNGNAYISDNISYNTDSETIDSIPKFALIVSGNIYIDPKVSQLDGFYVAQPKDSDQCDAADGDCHGKFFTCHSNSSAPVPARDFLSASCRKNLTINGAVVAADVEFDRTKGDITGAFDSDTPAEIINFTPEMILGGSFFHGPSSASSNQSKIDSIISLPPIF